MLFLCSVLAKSRLMGTLNGWLQRFRISRACGPCQSKKLMRRIKGFYPGGL
jgi:hypothetical protein